MPLWFKIVAGIVSVFGTGITIYLIRPLLVEAGLTGTDVHKEETPEIAEMGGLGIVVGVSGGFVLAIGANAFLGIDFDVIGLLAVLATVLIVAFIGVFDDLLEISQLVKAASPLLAALPLMAIRAGEGTLKIPLWSSINFGIYYPLVLVPLGITGAANAVNMLAGFNGMEVGVGLVAAGSLAVVAWFTGSWTAFLILIVLVGALLATLPFNWHPSSILIGDVGTLTIGALLASAVIIGNFETAGVVIIIPYFIDFLLKAASGFPSENWAGEFNSEDGKLYAPCKYPMSFPQLIMKVAGGIKERNLTLAMMGIEAVAGLGAISLYLV